MAGPDEFDRLWAAWSSSLAAGARDSGRALGVGVVVVLAYALVLVVPGRLVVYDMPMDALIPLDGVWRMHFGQRPHVDFATPIGDLYYLLHRVAAWWTGADDPTVLAVTNALVGLPVFALAWLATRERLPEPLRVITATTIALAAMSPRTLDEEASVSFNAMYNRWGWELAFVGLLLVLIEPWRERRRREAWEGAILVTVMLALFWLKVTYLALVCAGLGIAVVCAPANRRLAVLGGAAGLLAVGISAVTPAGAAYLGDLRATAAAAADGGGLLRSSLLVPTLVVNRTSIVVLIGLAFGMSRAAAGDHGGAVGRAALAVMGLLGFSIVVASQNNDRTIPLLALGALIPVVAMSRWPRSPTFLPILALFPALLLLGPAWSDLRTAWTFLTTSEHRGYTSNEESPLAGLRIPTMRAPGVPEEGMVPLVLDGTIDGGVFGNLRPQSWNIDSPIIVDAGVALIEEHGLGDRKIASLTFSPIFPYYFRTEPPRGLLAWMDYGRTFGKRWDERACASLADSDVVMQPKVWLIEGMVEEHEACLQAEFVLLDEDPLWRLWKRKG